MSTALRVLVTGANGQVGHELLRALAMAASPSVPLPPEGGRSVASRVESARHPRISSPGSDALRQGSHPFPQEGGRAAGAGGCDRYVQGAPTHPPQSPFVPKGEANHPLPQEGGRAAGAGGCAAAPYAIIPATRTGRLEDGTSCEAIDIADPKALRAALDRVAPDVVLNAAAYTAVDRAEDEPELAQRVNGDAPGVIGTWAARNGARVVHWSTDYVFDGSARRPYREDDPTHPGSVYGRTKLAGEIALRASGARHLIIRTAWVYAARGHNFLRTMLRLGAERDALRVVDDQTGVPTPAALIADATRAMLDQWLSDPDADRDGVYHVVAAGQVTWCGFARAIFERAHSSGLLDRVPRVDAIGTAEYPTKAARPAYSVLDTGKLRDRFAIELPDWRSSLAAVIAELVG